MGISRLGANQYGKAENRIVRIYRDAARHELVDLNVSTRLRGNFTAAHIDGDQRDVLPTDSQKNTAFALAKEHGVRSPEDYALAVGRQLLAAVPNADEATIFVEQYPWDRITVGGNPHDHAFVRRGDAVRTTEVTVDRSGAQVISGVKDLVVLKSTGSEFRGFLKDRYTTLAETDDRILATSLVARWRYGGLDVDWNGSYESIRTTMLEVFADTYSRALQETLYRMGAAVLESCPGVTEISFSAPNKHHFLVDLEPFGVRNDGEVFIAADRPYGLIEATIVREASE